MNISNNDYPYLSIGTVARAFGVSENNIRRMEAAGLVHPARVESGYRLYSISNLSEIATVLTLKSFGFVYDDIRHHQSQPEDRNYLLEILMERQKHLEHLIRKLSRTNKDTFRFQWELSEYPATCCFVQSCTFVPTLSSVSEISRQLFYESIRRGLPIDYTRAILFNSDCRDYHEFNYRIKQPYEICVPLREFTEGDDIQVLPGAKAISLGWTNTDISMQSIFRLLEETMQAHRLTQSDTLRAALDISSYTGVDDPIQGSILHFVIPVTEKES